MAKKKKAIKKSKGGRGPSNKSKSSKVKKLIKQHRLKTHTDCRKIKGLSGLSRWVTKNKMNHLFLK